MKLPTLDQLRAELERGLAGAIQASAKGNLSAEQARRAAASVIAGRGLPTDTAEAFSDDQPVCTLVCFDADNIQKWVFDSERVQVAAGASHILDHLNQRARNPAGEIPGVTGTLYSAGGSGILFANAAVANRELVETTRRWIEKRSRELTFTVIAEDLKKSDLEPGGKPRPVAAAGAFGLDRFQVVGGVQGALVRTQVLMRQAKDSNPRFEPGPSLAAGEGVRAERCPSCGHRRPGKSPVTDRGPEFWCGWCLGIRRWIRQQRDRPFERGGEPITFAQLAESVSRRRQYLGFIALDGNAMGSVVQGMRTFLQLRAFSEATSAIYEGARQRAQEVLAGYLDDGWLPEDAVLSLLSGGDEVTLVMAAAAVPEVAAAVLEAVETGFDRQTGDGGLLHQAFSDDPNLLGLLRRAGSAAGVVTAHSNYPVSLLRGYAYELQKQAKRACAEHDYRSALAWRLLTDSSPLTERLEPEPSPEMDVRAFEDLLAAARAAREVRVPASAFQRLIAQYRSEERSVRSLAGAEKHQVLDLVAANYFRYQLARNDRLRAWWRRVSPGDGDGGDAAGASNGERPVIRDPVTAWFEGGGGRRLGKLVELLTLEPFATAEIPPGPPGGAAGEQE